MNTATGSATRRISGHTTALSTPNISANTVGCHQCGMAKPASHRSSRRSATATSSHTEQQPGEDAPAAQQPSRPGALVMTWLSLAVPRRRETSADDHGDHAGPARSRCSGGDSG